MNFLAKSNKNFLIVCLVFLVVYIAIPTKWYGYAYPDKNNLSRVLDLGQFKSEDECIAAAINALRRASSPSLGDYECHKR